MNSTIATSSNFDIAYYPGLTAQDVIPKLINNLKQTFQNLPEGTIQYKAIQTYIKLLTNYLVISSSCETYSTQTVSIFNQLSEHLMKYVKIKYPEYDIYIEPQGRIKSPVSANIKIKERISKYLRENKDFSTLTITDFIAFRFILDARDAYGNSIPEEISVNILYDIINETINFISNCNFTTLLPISPVNKPKTNDNIPDDVYHPTQRPNYIEEKNQYIKDFIFSPKPQTNYQSAHLKIAFNIPGLNDPILGELQFRTFLMNEYAEKGPASHQSYKTREKISYLAIPQILMPIVPYSHQVDFLHPDIAFEKFLGFPPKQINPFMSYNFLQNFLEESHYTLPVLPLYFKKDNNETISLYDDFKTICTMPLEIIGSENQEELFALVADIFDEKNIKKEIEHDFI